jgi:hypothetical protein
MSNGNLTNTEPVSSRYHLVPLKQDDLISPGSVRFSMWFHPPLPDLRDATRHIVSVEEIGRMDLISYREYGMVDYWWILCEANNIKNPLFEMKAGDTVFIPTRESINLILGVG